MLKTSSVAKLLTAEGKPYSMNGNEGVSYKARFLIDDSIFEFKTTKDVVSDLSTKLEKMGTLSLTFLSRKEVLITLIDSFVVKG